MKRRQFIAASGAMMAGAMAAPLFPMKGQRRKPNLLFIFTDQQRPDTMAVYGNEVIKAPNLNKLAEESFVFRNSYVTQPVCTPSRSSLLTGQWPHTNGCTANNVPLRTSTRCFPELLAEDDYATAYMGKWHLGDEIFAQHGFNEWEAIDDNYSKYYSEGRDRSKRSGYYHWLVDKGYKPDKKSNTFKRKEVSELPYEASKPKFLEEKATDFLDRNKDNPFILYVNFFEPHSPFNGPFNEHHSLDEVTLPGNHFDPLEENEPLRNKLLREEFVTKGVKGYDVEGKDGWETVIRNYWGLVSQVDKATGKILDKLEQSGLKDDTIVVFTSDHGDMMASHKMALKTVMYEESAKVPFMIRYPRLNRKQKLINANVSHIDVVPTLLDLMNVNVKPGNQLQGKSLLPLMAEDKQDSGDVFCEWNPNYRKDLDDRLELSMPGVTEEERDRMAGQSVRTVVTPDGWKLCLSDRDKGQLFNLVDDPGETINLFDHPHFSDTVMELTAKIISWQEQTNDTLVL